MTDKSLAWPGTDWEVPGMAGAMTAVLWRLIRRKWGLVCLQYPGMARHVLHGNSPAWPEQCQLLSGGLLEENGA